MPDHYTLLLEWRRSEGATRGLAKLPHDFYATTREYLAESRRTFENELRENPTGRKMELARQTSQRAGQVARDILEGRMTKLLSAAFQASVGGNRDLPNALAEDRALFEELLDLLRRHRLTIAPYLEASSAPPLAPAKPAESAAPTPEVASPTLPPTVVVRIIKDTRPIESGGETLDLRKEDVLSLPPATAKLLVKGGLAEEVAPGERGATT
ncbi:MAG: hypothetical protein L3K09_05990 [Thermoplasmata archaeon]|nr:hypothetical protein [Thermoplasmata archaeon]